jgi:hypothetical protein
MKFCPLCNNRMEKIPTDEGIVFRCLIDGEEIKGLPGDHRLGGGGGDQAAWMAQLYSSTLQHSSRDPATKRVPRPCPDCKLPYLRQVILGRDDLVVWYLCECGYQTPSAEYDESKTSEKALADLEKTGWEADRAAGYDPEAHAAAHAKYAKTEASIKEAVAKTRA